MQTEAKNSSKPTPEEEYSSKNLDQTISLHLMNTENEEMSQEGSDWLDQEFKRLPYILYRCWIILTFGAVGIIIYLLVKDFWTQYKGSDTVQLENTLIELVLYNIIHVILLFGCCQMLFGMMKKKAIFAEKGIMKLQISMIGSTLLASAKLYITDWTFSASDPLALFFIFGLPLIVIMNLVGGFVVLKAFKKNHPLTRDSQRIEADLLQQNEVIAAELLKYDQQLERWPYLIYKVWLVFSSIWEILNVCVNMMIYLRSWSVEGIEPLNLIFQICALQFYFLNGVGSYEMIFALRRKMLARSKRAILLLKICISLTVILSTIGGLLKGDILARVTELLGNLWIPSITLLGAFRANKILEKREDFAKFSNFNDTSCYI